MTDAGDRAGAQVETIHDRRIQLDAAVGGQRQHRPPRPGVEQHQWIILQRRDRRFHRIERAATALEQALTGGECLHQAMTIGVFACGSERHAWQRAGAAMDGQGIH